MNSQVRGRRNALGNTASAGCTGVARRSVWRLHGIYMFAGVALLSACSKSQNSTDTATNQQADIAPAVACSDLQVQLSLADTTLASVSLDAGGTTNSQYPDAGPEPENCVVTGTIGAYTSSYVDPDTGSSGYGTGFEVRLPTHWNGRFLYQGGGGGDGYVAMAAGPIPGEGSLSTAQPNQTPALWRGFAVVSSDGGHHSGSSQSSFFGSGFGIDPVARVNYGYASIGQVTPVAKQIIGRYYAQQPSHSYFAGCSKGGQEAMQASQRYGDQFDGIVVGDPGFHLPHAAIAQAWETQALAVVASTNDPTAVDGNGDPLLYKAFTKSDLELIRQGVVQACDKLDSVADGMIFDTVDCAGQFDPSSLQCSGAKRPSCLSAVQVSAVRKIFDGARSSDNTALYASYPYDTGITSFIGWPGSYLGPPIGVNSAFNLLIGTESSAYVFTTPPDPTLSLFTVNIDQFAQATRATSGAYDVSADDFMDADSTDLDVFKGRGGKILFYHGVSDAVFSANDTVDYYRQLSSAYGSDTAGFARLFLVPGMGHCASGDYSADYFDGLDAIVNWVEQGQAPDSILAKPANTDTTKLPAATSRPLCAYPRYARYKGSGDVNDASNFSCANPTGK